MEPQIYQELAEQEDAHWWFRARRAIATSLIKRFPLSSNAQILDAGCGSGGNLAMLKQFGKVHAFELDDGSRARAAARGIGPVESGKLPGGIPFGSQSFDLITLFDVLEHIEDDRAALTALASRLKPGGMLLINVPAFQFLFSQHDVAHHHFRRYGWDELKQKVEAAGLEIGVMNYWNCLLFPVAAIVRLLERRRISSPIRGEVRRGASMESPCQFGPHPGPPPNGEGEVGALGSGTPPPFVNALLTEIVSAERFLLPRLLLPFGTSIIIVAEKIG